MIYLYIVLIALVAGALYRMGGTKLGTLWRDIGVPVCVTLAMIILGKFHWSLILCFGALYGSLTTYHKYMGYLFNRPDKKTVYAESWLMTGFCYGFSMLPYTIFANNWDVFWYRTLLCAALTCLWSENIGKAWVEESGRGFIIVATLLLFILR